MKKIFRKILGALLVPALMFSSCESMDELNVDPTRMNEANAGSFLNPIIYGMGTYTWTRYNSWTFQLMQCLVTTNTTNGVGWYRISDAAGDGAWSTYYKWATNAQSVYNYGVSSQQTNYQAIGLTLKCWMFHILTDAFGDIPMQEACKGEQSIFYPKFDTQLDVYRSIIDSLEVANSLYNPSQGLKFNDGGDKMYCKSSDDEEGLLRWRKFTNSLRMRVLLRVIDVPELNADLELKKMLADPDTYPIFGSNDEAARVNVSGVAPEEAPMTRPSDLSSYKQLSKFFIDKLLEWNDPRLPIFAKQATNYDENGNEYKSYIGLPSGYDITPTISGSAPNADNLATAPQDLWCLTYAEILFIKTELAWRGIIEADAEELYKIAVKAAVEQWGAELPEDYFENPIAAYDGTLKRIMEQKFYALFFIDFQQWFEYNRTGYPDVPHGPGVATGDTMPYRYRYPAILQRMNKDNYDRAVDSMGGDELNTRLIWQKR